MTSSIGLKFYAQCTSCNLYSIKMVFEQFKYHLYIIVIEFIGSSRYYTRKKHSWFYRCLEKKRTLLHIYLEKAILWTVTDSHNNYYRNSILMQYLMAKYSGFIVKRYFCKFSTLQSLNWNLYSQKILGGAGHRSRYLSHAKRALYHLSYAPFSLMSLNCHCRFTM